ncbi:MAG: hypothetical protein WB795_07650 [Candidatus Acidiferrales bacterium]
MAKHLPEFLPVQTRFNPSLAKALLVALFAILVLLPLWMVRYPPLIDYPDYLARAFIITHLKDPAYQFSDFYSTQWGPYPYLGTDLSLIALQHLLPAEAAGRVLLSICVIAVPMAGWWFLRKANPGHAALALWALLLCYDPFFLDGFVNFQLGLALCFFTSGWWLRYLEKPTTVRWIALLALATCVYFTHLIAFGITGFVVLAYSLARRLNLRQILWSWGVFVPGVILFFVWHTSSHDGAEIAFRSLPQKFFAARAELLRSYSLRFAVAAFCVIVICIFGAWFGNREFHWNRTWLIVFLATLGLYLALPNEIEGIWMIDVRLVPALFLLLLGVAQLGHRQRVLAFVAILLCGIRTVDVARNFRLQQAGLSNTEAAIQMLPRGARVLPIINVDIVNDDLLHQFYGHFWEYAIIQRGVLAPFRLDLQGQTPLRFNDQAYIPDDPETWPPNWKEVCDHYDYVWTYAADYYNRYLLGCGTEVYHSGRMRLFRLENGGKSTQPLGRAAGARAILLFL